MDLKVFKGYLRLISKFQRNHFLISKIQSCVQFNMLHFGLKSLNRKPEFVNCCKLKKYIEVNYLDLRSL